MTNKIKKYEKRMKKYQKKLNFDDPNFRFEIYKQRNDKYLQTIKSNIPQPDIWGGSMTPRERANSIMQDYGPYKRNSEVCKKLMEGDRDIDKLPLPSPKKVEEWGELGGSWPPRTDPVKTITAPFCGQIDCKTKDKCKDMLSKLEYASPKRSWPTSKTTWKVGDKGWKKALCLAIEKYKAVKNYKKLDPYYASNNDIKPTPGNLKNCL